MSASIIGWSHTAFGKHADKSIEDLMVTAAQAAIADAGISPADVDEIFVGHFNSGFSHQSLLAGMALQVSPLLRFKPSTRVENACASGAAAVFQGLRAIEAGKARLVLVVGVEKMTDTKGEQVVARAASRVGVPYVFGVTDCSWLSLVCIADVTGIDLPHNAHAQHLDPRVNAITRAQLKPGDLVFIDDDHHVAIFLDEMYGGRVWDTEPHDTSCPSNWAHDGMLGVGVRIRPMFLPWYCGRINGYGRIPQVNG